MTRPSSHPGANVGYWLMVFVACVVFLLEARRARSRRHMRLNVGFELHGLVSGPRRTQDPGDIRALRESRQA